MTMLAAEGVKNRLLAGARMEAEREAERKAERAAVEVLSGANMAGAGWWWAVRQEQGSASGSWR